MAKVVLRKALFEGGAQLETKNKERRASREIMGAPIQRIVKRKVMASDKNVCLIY